MEMKIEIERIFSRFSMGRKIQPKFLTKAVVGKQKIKITFDTAFHKLLIGCASFTIFLISNLQMVIQY